jgi:hypothetical protein
MRAATAATAIAVDINPRRFTTGETTLCQGRNLTRHILNRTAKGLAKAVTGHE